MFTVLKVSKEKISDKLIKSVEDRVTTIRRETEHSIGFDEVVQALMRSFPETFCVETFHGGLSDDERALAERLKTEKYITREWIFERPDKYRKWL